MVKDAKVLLEPGLYNLATSIFKSSYVSDPPQLRPVPTAELHWQASEEGQRTRAEQMGE